MTAERKKLCIWLESEKRKLAKLGPHQLEQREQKEQELEREFRARLDRLYGDVREEPGRADKVPRPASSKLN